MAEYHSENLAGRFFWTPPLQIFDPQMVVEIYVQRCLEFAQNCPQCVIIQGAGGKQKSPPHPIPTECPFQIVGVDAIKLYTNDSKRQQVCLRPVH